MKEFLRTSIPADLFFPNQMLYARGMPDGRSGIGSPATVQPPTPTAKPKAKSNRQPLNALIVHRLLKPTAGVTVTELALSFFLNFEIDQVLLITRLSGRS